MSKIPDAAPLSTWVTAADEYAASEPGAGGSGDRLPSDRRDASVSYPPILLAGMHRSGTSLFGRYLALSGVSLGERLLGPLPSNPHGHFEDLDFAELHEAAIRRWEQAGRFRKRSPEAYLAPGEIAAARALVRSRREAGRPWGWKDPRASLFLEFWRAELPDARFVILLRDPLVVTDSLCRRQECDTNSVTQNDQALGMWLGYNRFIARFVPRHRQACVLLHLDTALAEPDRTASLLTAQTGYPFSGDVLRDCYESELLRTEPSRPRPVSLRRRVAATLLYRQLRAQCDR